MPELPEVEVVRRGLAAQLTNAQVTAVTVHDARSLKRHLSLAELASNTPFPGHGRTLDTLAQQLRAQDFTQQLTGQQLGLAQRRGKFLWLPLLNTEQVLLAHLGMSGQLLVQTEKNTAPAKHVHISVELRDSKGNYRRLDFADQRRFGSLAIDQLIPNADGKPTTAFSKSLLIPQQVAHIARDVLDPHLDTAALLAGWGRQRAAMKKTLLEQHLVSGIGNIYADEALWQAQIHPETPGERVGKSKLRALLNAAQDVMQRALSAGGTSFDALYVNTAGEAGYFARSLNAYGRAGKPCNRCGTTLQVTKIAGRSSHYCGLCQRRR